MQIVRDEHKDPLTGRSYTTISYLVDKDETLEDLSEAVKGMHPGCDLEMTFCRDRKKLGFKVRVMNGKDHKFV